MRITTAAAFAAASLVFSPAMADEDEIVVTATRRPAPASELPARVAVINREDIERRSLHTLSDALGTDAIQSGGAGQQASLFLRGANSNHVLALLDGVRLNDASTPNGQYDFGQDGLGALQRVEVLRGPASAVYGSDAIGGVVNMIPRRGGDVLYAPYVELALGSFGAARALVGAAGGAGGIEYGVSGEWLNTRGVDQIPARMATHTGDPDGSRMTALTASVRTQRGAYGLDALLRVRDSMAEFDTFSGGAFFDLRADDPDLENNATQTVWRLGADRDVSGASSLRLSGGQVLSDRRETDNGATSSAAQSVRDFAEATASFEPGALHTVVGLVWERDAIEVTSPFAAPLAVSEQQGAAFAVAQLETAPGLVVTGSLRLDRYDGFGSEVTYSAGAVWRRAPLRAFASYGVAFKAPTLSQRFETSSFVTPNPELAPERARSWELGADWADSEHFELGGSLYGTVIENLIQYDFAQLSNINVGRANISGVEAYATARAADWLRLRIAYTYTDARNDLSGAQLARRPAHSWRLEARMTPLPRLSLDLGWSIVGSRTDVTYAESGQFESGRGRVGGFEVGAASATFALSERAQVFARVDNAGDETYEQPAAFAAPSRSVTAGLRVAF